MASARGTVIGWAATGVQACRGATHPKTDGRRNAHAYEKVISISYWGMGYCRKVVGLDDSA